MSVEECSCSVASSSLTLLGALTLGAAVTTRIEEVEEDDAGIKIGLSEIDPDKSTEEVSDASECIDSCSSRRFTPK